MRGWSKNASHGGVVGVNTGGGMGVYGDSASGVGIWGSSANREGVHAETKSSATAALVAHQLNAASDTAALYAKHASPQGLAAVLEGKVLVQGNVLVTGDIQLANAADCAEEFDIAAETCVEPGTVMVLNDDGTLQASSQPHDTRVVGVISGAGRYRPGLVLDKQESLAVRQPIALMGKVFCKADAHFGAISVGDLLTSSPTPGHAMKTNDPRQAFGAVIGKALRPLAGGRGLIPILIALQ